MKCCSFFKHDILYSTSAVILVRLRSSRHSSFHIDKRLSPFAEGQKFPEQHDRSVVFTFAKSNNHQYYILDFAEEFHQTHGRHTFTTLFDKTSPPNLSSTTVNHYLTNKQQFNIKIHFICQYLGLEIFS